MLGATPALLQPVFKVWSAVTKQMRTAHPPHGFQMPKYRNSCMVVVKELPRPELGGDIYLNIDIIGGGDAAMEIAYILVE